MPARIHLKKSTGKKPDAFVVMALFASHGIPAPTPEFRFHPERKWRFDYAWPDKMIALEIEGGIWISGRHSRGSGMQADMEKYNAAAIMGWRLLRCTPKQLASGEILASVAAAMLKQKGGN